MVADNVEALTWVCTDLSPGCTYRCRVTPAGSATGVVSPPVCTLTLAEDHARLTKLVAAIQAKVFVAGKSFEQFLTEFSSSDVSAVAAGMHYELTRAITANDILQIKLDNERSAKKRLLLAYRAQVRDNMRLKTEIVREAQRKSQVSVHEEASFHNALGRVLRLSAYYGETKEHNSEVALHKFAHVLRNCLSLDDRASTSTSHPRGIASRKREHTAAVAPLPSVALDQQINSLCDMFKSKWLVLSRRAKRHEAAAYRLRSQSQCFRRTCMYQAQRINQLHNYVEELHGYLGDTGVWDSDEEHDDALSDFVDTYGL